MEMQSLRDVFQRRLTTLKVATPLSTQELEQLNVDEKRRLHLLNCPACSGDSRISGWPCIDDPGYRWKIRRFAAGLSWVAHNTFSSFKADSKTKEAFRTCQTWAENSEGWLTLVGGPGTGKTHLAMAVVERLLQREQIGRFFQTADLLDWWRGLYDKSEEPKANWERWGDIIVVLDDLGAERPTEWAIEKLGQFLDWRTRGRLPTLITTNYGKEELGSRLHPRIADRVFDTGSGLVRVERLTGTSYRTARI